MLHLSNPPFASLLADEKAPALAMAPALRAPALAMALLTATSLTHPSVVRAQQALPGLVVQGATLEPPPKPVAATATVSAPAPAPQVRPAAKATPKAAPQAAQAAPAAAVPKAGECGGGDRCNPDNCTWWHRG
jgi:hypothetical protein